MGSLLAGLGFIVTGVSSLHYLSRIPSETVPERPWAHRAGLALGALVALVGLVLQPGLAAGILAATTLGIAVLHLKTLAEHALPPASPAVVVGSPLPGFKVLD